MILVPDHDFGRCPLAIYLPTSLWPVGNQSALEHILDHLAKDGIEQVVICSNSEDLYKLQNIHVDKCINLKLVDEQLPAGTAGAIRLAMDSVEDEILLVLPGSLIHPPDINILLKTHKESGCDLTVMLNPAEHDKQTEQASGVYVCSSNVLKYIPKDGHCDIKEGLISKMLRAGKSINAVTLPHSVGNFRNRQEYIYAIRDYLENNPKMNIDMKLKNINNSQNIWIGTDTEIDSTSRVYGPAVIMDGARISEDTVILGPTIIGQNVTIDKGSIVENSVIWDNAQINSNCQIRQCLIDFNAIIQTNTIARDRSLLSSQKSKLGLFTKILSNISKPEKSKLNEIKNISTNKFTDRLPKWAQFGIDNIFKLLLFSFIVGAFLWSYWPGLNELWKVWMRNDEYSSGLLVPFIALYVLWLRRHTIISNPIKPSLFGILLFLGAQAIRLLGLFFMYGSAEYFSILLSIFALVLLLFGWRIFQKTVTVLLFLFLMLPWPNRFQLSITLPLQQWSTSSAVFCLELMSFDLVQEGNVIHIGETTVAVAEACNGLRMITAFFVITGLVALLIKRPLWEKITIIASSLPIALLCNTIRLAITAIFFTILEGEYWEQIFHDFGGYAMMPLALAVIVAELWLLKKLTTPPVEKKEIIITRHNSQAI
ncbi:exosortase [Planctomycetota bacterium]